MVARGPITTTIFLAVVRCLFPGTPIQTGVKIAEMSDMAKVSETITFKKNWPVTFDSGGLGLVFTCNSLLAQYYPDLLHLATINGMHCTGDAIKMDENFGARTIEFEWVQVHPTGLVKPDDPDAEIKFLAEALRGVGGLVFDALGNLYVYELGRRDYVTGEMWKNKPPFRLALNRAASDKNCMALQASQWTRSHEVLRVWRSTCPGCWSARVEDGGIERSPVSGFFENGRGS